MLLPRLVGTPHGMVRKPHLWGTTSRLVDCAPSGRTTRHSAVSAQESALPAGQPVVPNPTERANSVDIADIIGACVREGSRSRTHTTTCPRQRQGDRGGRSSRGTSPTCLLTPFQGHRSLFHLHHPSCSGYESTALPPSLRETREASAWYGPRGLNATPTLSEERCAR